MFSLNHPSCVYYLTWICVGVRREHHTQTGLVVDRFACVVRVACLQAVGQHQRAGYAVQQVIGRREHVPGNQLEPRHVGLTVLQRSGRRHRQHHEARVQRAHAGLV